MAPLRDIRPSRGGRSLGPLLLLTGLLWGCTTGGFQAPAAPKPEEIPALEREAAAGSNDVDVLVRLGAAYRAADRLDDAERVLQQALRADESSESAIFVLGLVYDESGADSSAVTLYRKYLDEHPGGALA
ncbi:MAG: tetratricopeptide repeat protein, partial [Gemmatimonadota bacterium]